MTKYLLPTGIILLSIGAAVWMYAQHAVPPARVIEAPISLIEATTVKAEDVQIGIEAQGTVTPRTQTTLVSEVSGLITAVSPAFVAGGFFSKGDLLVRIDDRNYRAEVKRAEAAVAAAETNLRKEAGLAEYAKKDWEKAREVIGSSKAASDLALRKPQMDEAKANLDFAHAELERRQGDLDRTVIRAPYAGLVREKKADVGQFVAAGTPIATTFAVDVAEIRLPLTDRDLPYVDLDFSDGTTRPKVMFSAEIGGEEHYWQGEITRTEGVFDTKSRVLYAVAQVKDPYNRLGKQWPSLLRIGTFVQAKIFGKFVKQLIRLPRSAITQSTDGMHQVWVVTSINDDEGLLEQRTVKIYRTDANFALIESGLKTGETVSLTVSAGTLAGTRVRILNPNQDESENPAEESPLVSR